MNSLFLNNQFLEGIQGGGDFSRENIRISFNRDDASSGIKSIKFYELDSKNQESTNPDVIPGYIIKSSTGSDSPLATTV